jgi:hypothetical protein
MPGSRRFVLQYVDEDAFKDIIAEIRDLGFVRGAKLKRDDERVASFRRVDFNQGVDARILCKNRIYLRELSSHMLEPPSHRVRPFGPQGSLRESRSLRP